MNLSHLFVDFNPRYWWESHNWMQVLENWRIKDVDFEELLFWVSCATSQHVFTNLEQFFLLPPFFFLPVGLSLSVDLWRAVFFAVGSFRSNCTTQYNLPIGWGSTFQFQNYNNLENQPIDYVLRNWFLLPHFQTCQLSEYAGHIRTRVT